MAGYDQKKDYQWFLLNRENLIKEYLGKSVLIQNEKVVGIYDNDSDALTGAINLGLNEGEYIIQVCLPPERTDLHYYTGRYKIG